MAQQLTSLADRSVYFRVQDLLCGTQSKSDKEAQPAVTKSGSLYCPSFPVFPEKAYDEVYPKIYLGNRQIVKDYEKLKALGITHLVNASMGAKFNQINTSQEFYQDYGITFHGIPAQDMPSFQILPHLRDAAEFLDKALGDNGTVYVHCQQGVSRSATVVIAFLMLKRNMDLYSAVKLIRSKRLVHPNEGFVKQLCKLQEEINDKGT